MTFYYFCSWYVQKGICTFQRFLFLNFYAFLLLFGGIGIGVIPLYQKSLWYIAPQLIFVIICIRGSIGIFSSWEQKKERIFYFVSKKRKRDTTWFIFGLYAGTMRKTIDHYCII